MNEPRQFSEVVAASELPTNNGAVAVDANIPKLDGTNFASWYELVSLVLEIKGLDGAIGSDATPAKIRLQAKLVLLESMNESHRAQVRGCSTPKEIISRLQLIYRDKSAANIYRLLHQYYRYDKKSEDSISEHVGRMDEMRNQLADLGETQSEAVYQVTLIGSLPSEYSSIMEVWELTHPDMRTTANLISRLLKREDDLKRSSDQALVTRGQGQRQMKPRTPQEIEELKKRTRCGICKAIGHWVRECPKRDQEQTSDQNNKAHFAGESVETEIAFNVFAFPKDLGEKWISDSGASAHMSNNLSWFNEFSESSVERYVTVGDGKKLRVMGSGTIGVESLVNGVWRPSKMTNVLFVPGLTTNLFSIGAAAERGITTTFTGNECRMTYRGKVIASGAKFSDKLYMMRIRTRSVASGIALPADAPLTINRYHRRLGYVGSARIQQLLRQLGIEQPRNENIDCSDFPGGSGRHPSHPPRGIAQQEPGHLHADLSGIVTKESLKGYRYYMVCKDELSEFTVVYHCKNKTEVPRLLASLIVDFEAISGAPVRSITTDCGSEFVNDINKLLLLKNKVTHHTSAPFCPQQNGRIEREMQSINTMARTILNGSKLPKDLWPEAVATSVYLKNRLPTSSCNISPLERLTGQKPRIDHIVEFGTPVHLIVNGEYLTKWDARSNTYKIFMSTKRRVVESCDVIFASHSSNGSPSPLPTATCQSGCTVSGTSGEADYVTNCGRETNTHEHSDHPVSDNSEISNNIPPSGEESQSSGGFQTPLQTMGDMRESTPEAQAKPRCTGERLDEFFRQYVNDENVYEELGQQPVYANDGASNNQRPSVPPPPPPNEQLTAGSGAAEESIPSPSYSTLTQKGEGSTVAEFAGLGTDHAPTTPSTYSEVANDMHASEWKKAIDVEFDAHNTNNTWQVVPVPTDKKMLNTKWVFTVKYDAHGNLERFKARLVVRGFEQTTFL